ncbi:hypothetical protein ACOMHN_056070 [Nucella lapillus]
MVPRCQKLPQLTASGATALSLPYPVPALPCPCPTLSLPYPVPALPCPCPTLSLPYPVPALSLPYPAPALPCPCPTLSLPYPVPALPCPCPTLSLPYPAPALTEVIEAVTTAGSDINEDDDETLDSAVSVLRWMDKKPVHVLTTKMDPRQMVNIISRNNRSNQKLKQEAVQDYIDHMAGVDKSDQLMSYTPFHRKTMKWWKKMFFHLFTLSIIQSSILHEIYHTGRGGKKLPLKQFVVRLGLAMNDRYQAGVAAAAAAAAGQAAANPPVPAVAPPAPVPAAAPPPPVPAAAPPAPVPAAAPPAPVPAAAPPPPVPAAAPPAPVPAAAPPPPVPAAAPPPPVPAAAPPPPVPAAAPPPPVPAAVGQTRLVGCGHYSTPIGQVESGTGRKKFRACHVCSSRAKRHVGAKVRKTANVCAKCGVPLCDKIIQPQGNGDITCFRLYHTVKNYTDY